MASLPIEPDSLPVVRVVPGRQRRLSVVEEKRLVELYVGGGSVHELGEKFGVTRQCVSAVVKRHGVKLHYRVLDGERLAEAVRLYREGWSLERLGAHFEVSAKTVLNRFVASGVERRPVGTNQWS